MSNVSKIFVVMSVFSLVAMPAFAQTLTPKCNPTLPPGQPGACNVNAFITWVKQIISFMFTIAIPLAVIFIVYGGFVMMTSGGSEERFAKGKQVITASVIGLAIALGAWLIIQALNFFIVAPGPETGGQDFKFK